MDPVMGEKRPSLPTGNTARCDQCTVHPRWIMRIFANLHGRRVGEQRREQEPMIIDEVASRAATLYRGVFPDDEEADAGFEELPSYSFASSHADPGLFLDHPSYSCFTAIPEPRYRRYDDHISPPVDYAHNDGQHGVAAYDLNEM